MTTELTKLSWMTDAEFEDLIIARKKFSERNVEFAYHPTQQHVQDVKRCARLSS